MGFVLVGHARGINEKLTTVTFKPIDWAGLVYGLDNQREEREESE